MAFITQNSIDGQWETWIDGVTIRGTDYERVERIASEVCGWRAQRQATEDALDEMEQQQQSPLWGSPEIAVGAWGAVVLIAVVAATCRVVPLIWAWIRGG